MHNPTGVPLFCSFTQASPLRFDYVEIAYARHNQASLLLLSLNRNIDTCLQLRFTPTGCCILQSIYIEITLCEELIPNSSFLIPNYYSLALIAALSASYPGLSRSANIFFL